jgi:hypothetical protein
MNFEYLDNLEGDISKAYGQLCTTSASYMSFLTKTCECSEPFERREATSSAFCRALSIFSIIVSTVFLQVANASECCFVNHELQDGKEFDLRVMLKNNYGKGR